MEIDRGIERRRLEIVLRVHLCGGGAILAPCSPVVGFSRFGSVITAKRGGGVCGAICGNNQQAIANLKRSFDFTLKHSFEICFWCPVTEVTQLVLLRYLFSCACMRKKR
jgi:hypothetical protein